MFLLVVGTALIVAGCSGKMLKRGLSKSRSSGGTEHVTMSLRGLGSKACKNAGKGLLGYFCFCHFGVGQWTYNISRPNNGPPFGKFLGDHTMTKPGTTTPAFRPDRPPNTQKNSGTTWTLSICGALLVIIGVSVGFSPVDSLCGSPFNPDTSGARFADSFSGSYGGRAAGCTRELATGRGWAIAWLVLAVVLFLSAGLAALIRSQNRTSAALSRQTSESSVSTPLPLASPTTVTHRLEEAVRLHEQGTITDEEFQAKRAELLEQL